MAVTVTGKFVATGNDASNHSRVALGDPAQCEKRRSDVACIQNSQNTFDIALDAALSARPGITCDVRCEGRDLKIIFDIDRHGIANARVRHRDSPIFVAGCTGIAVACERSHDGLLSSLIEAAVKDSARSTDFSFVAMTVSCAAHPIPIPLIARSAISARP